MKIGFIGAGKVGCTLGKLFSTKGIPVTGYYSLHRESAEFAAAFTDTQVYDDQATLVRDSDAIFITVSDQMISSVYDEIKDMGIRDKLICHCSGAMTAAEAFGDAKVRGAFGYAIHPLFPISSKTTSYRELTGAFFCLEGDGPHLGWWEENLRAMGVVPKAIDGSSKITYHAACAIASNLVVALLAESMELLETCGFSAEESRKALAPLVKANVQKVLEVGPVDALTGPVERGDVGTVRKHVESFCSTEEKELYQVTSRKLLEVARRKHPENTYEEMEKVLSERRT